MVVHYAQGITLLLIVLLIILTALVAAGRAQFKIAAPAMTGHPDFEKRVRCHANTVESALVFLPTFWIATTLAPSTTVTALGLAWVIVRALYAISYLGKPMRRVPFFIIGQLILTALLLIAGYHWYQTAKI